MTSAQPILVLGGSGHYGRLIVDALIANGQTVRVLSRNVENARRVLGETPEVIEGDILSKESITSALEGSRSIVIAVSAFSWKMIRKRLLIERDAILSVLEEAEKTGISRVAYLSGYDVQEGFMKDLGLMAFARPMLDVQAALAASSLNWTVLGCAPSMEIFFAMIRGQTMNVPGGGPEALAVISSSDVGQIAAQAVVRDDLGKQRFRLTGPETLSFPEAARRISEVWGQTIRFRRIPLTPLKIAGFVTWPFNPFIRRMVDAIKLMNRFPAELVADVPRDHQRLRDTFDYTPVTLEEEAERLKPKTDTPERQL